MPRFNTSSGKANLVALRTKRKTTAELVNEQLGRQRGDGDAREDNYGAVEDYEFDTRGSGSDDENEIDTRTRTKSLASSSLAGAKRRRASEEGGRLRRRGPLDPSLSEGVYAAAPVNVEAAMDDLFGALDMGDMDIEGEEMIDDGDDYDDDEEEDDEENLYGDEDEEGEDSDDSAGRGPSKGKAGRVRRAKDLSEDEYIAWLEKRNAQRRGGQQGSGAPAALSEEQLKATLSHGPLAGEEVAIVQQLEALRQTQLGLVSGGGGAGADGASHEEAAAEEKAQMEKERASLQAMTRRYLHLFGQLLRIRVKLQPAVNNAMRLPQYYALPFFLRPAKYAAGQVLADVSSAAEKTALVAQSESVSVRAVEVQEELKDVLGLLWRVGAVLEGKSIAAPTRKRPRVETKQAGRSKKGAAAVDVSEIDADASPSIVPNFDAIEQYHQHMLGSVKTCLDLWGQKMVQPNSAKLTTISQPLTQQIEAILASKARLLHKVQKNRAHVPILGHPDHVRTALEPENTEVKVKRAMQVAAGDVDEEIFDDGDFLRELVRRGGALSARLEHQLKETEKASLPQKGPARKGFHRLTKGKTVDYEPHPKLVGFVVPDAIEDSGRKDVVLQSLFQ